LKVRLKFSVGGRMEQTSNGLIERISVPDGIMRTRHSTVTLLARLRGWSTSHPLKTAIW